MFRLCAWASASKVCPPHPLPALMLPTSQTADLHPSVLPIIQTELTQPPLLLKLNPESRYCISTCSTSSTSSIQLPALTFNRLIVRTRRPFCDFAVTISAFGLKLITPLTQSSIRPRANVKTEEKKDLLSVAESRPNRRFSCVILPFPVSVCFPSGDATLRRAFSPFGLPARQPQDSGGPANLAIRHSLSRPSYLHCIKVIAPWVLCFPGDSCCRRVG